MKGFWFDSSEFKDGVAGMSGVLAIVSGAFFFPAIVLGRTYGLWATGEGTAGVLLAGLLFGLLQPVLILWAALYIAAQDDEEGTGEF